MVDINSVKQVSQLVGGKTLNLATLDTRTLARAPHRTTAWVSADLAELGPARQQMYEWLAGRLGPDDPMISDVLLVFSELLAAAIVASPDGQEIRYSYSDDGRQLLVRMVSQNGCEIDSVNGLALVKKLADRVEFGTSGREIDVSAQFDRRRSEAA